MSCICTFYAPSVGTHSWMMAYKQKINDLVKVKKLKLSDKVTNINGYN